MENLKAQPVDVISVAKELDRVKGVYNENFNIVNEFMHWTDTHIRDLDADLETLESKVTFLRGRLVELVNIASKRRVPRWNKFVAGALVGAAVFTATQEYKAWRAFNKRLSDLEREVADLDAHKQNITDRSAVKHTEN